LKRYFNFVWKARGRRIEEVYENNILVPSGARGTKWAEEWRVQREARFETSL